MDDLYASWRGIHACEGNFARANLTGADMHRSYLGSSDFSSYKLEGTDLRGANVNECGFGGAHGKFLSSKPVHRYST
ncbi:MAG: pentapeptide repeat-containing protein [Pseudomonas sp.]|uniref:pentapeptide repeat-containing protein n=1 Tax=Pseudomonas sp. TaxID=306 RepID=UPI003D6F3861